MGVMFAMKCDLCGLLQVKEKPYEIQGTNYNENGETKFACQTCRGKMKAAWELKTKGLKDPLKKVAGLIEQRDRAIRERDEALSALKGENPYAAVAIGNPKAVLQAPKGAEAAARIAMGVARAHGIAGPETKKGTRKKSAK